MAILSPVDTVVGYTRNLIHRGAEMLSRVQEMKKRGRFPLVRLLHCTALVLMYAQSARELIELSLSLGMFPPDLADEFLSDAYALVTAAEAEFDRWEQWERRYPIIRRWESDNGFGVKSKKGSWSAERPL